MTRQNTPLIAGLILVGFLLIFPFIYTAGDYRFIMHVMITGFFYAILASSWSMLAGYAGQFSFGHMGFTGLGGYAAALFSHYFYITPEATGLCTEFALGGSYLVILDPVGVTSSTLAQDCLTRAIEASGGTLQATPMPVLLGIVLGALAGGVFGLLIGYLVLPLRAAYLALFTLGFSEILRAAISAEIAITRGQAGMELPGLFPSGLTVFGHHFDKTDKMPPYFVMLFLLLFSLAVLAWLAHSRFGLFVRALREDEDAAAALGVNTTRYKVLVFVITSMIAATAGAVMGYYVGIVTPNNLIILQMSLVVAMAVIGGVENIYAAAIGAIAIEFTLELLRNSFQIGPFTVDMVTWRLVVFGVLLMVTLRFSRNGLISPLIDYFLRGHVAAETVAGRVAAGSGDGEAE